MNQVNLTECFSVSVTFATSCVHLSQFSVLPHIPSHALCFLSLGVEIPRASCRGCCGSAYPPLSSSDFPNSYALGVQPGPVVSLPAWDRRVTHVHRNAHTHGADRRTHRRSTLYKREKHLRLTRSQHKTTLQNKQSHQHSFCASIAAPVADFTEHPT